MKKCLLLSNSDVVLLYNVRQIANKFKIQIVPCKYVFEMLDHFNDGVNAVLIDDNYNFLSQYVLGQEVLQYCYFFKNNYILNHKKEVVFKSLDEFFVADIFNKDLPLNFDNDYNLVSNSLSSLGIVSNSWKDRFIKLVLCEMHKSANNNVNGDIVKLVAQKCEVKCKNIYDAIRPIIKQYTQIISAKLNINFSKVKVNEVFNFLYNHVFKN